MLQKINVSLLALIAFNVLFWNQGIGINLVLFNSLLLTLALYYHRGYKINSSHVLLFISYAISGVSLVVLNTGWSVFLFVLSSVFLVVLLKQDQLKTLYDAGFSFLFTYSLQGIYLWKKSKQAGEQSTKAGKVMRSIKLFIVPLVLLFVFFQIYRSANPKFEAISFQFLENIYWLFEDWNGGRIAFNLVGLSFISWTLIRYACPDLPLIAYQDDLLRKKNRPGYKIEKNASLFRAFKNEFRMATLIFLLLNGLLLVVNYVDLNWVYFNFVVPEVFNLKQFVHEGTYLLLLSIFLSMGIVLYFFRGNFNFYQKNKVLQGLVYFWILQNAFLVVSVFMRNYHYIDYHGLAGKRIGMIAFLSMTLFGLITLILKIKKQKTSFFLLRVNTWFIFLCLVAMSTVNWDQHILDFNLKHNNPAEIDIDHYLKLDPRLSPQILENLDQIERQMLAHQQNSQIWVKHLAIDSFQVEVLNRAQKYHQGIQEETWPSWNLNDAAFKKAARLNQW